MPTNTEIVILLLIVGVGCALFFAAREFVRGVQLAKQEHDARRNAERGADSESGQKNGAKAPPPHEDEAPKIWHEILEVSPTARPEEIKVAYRRMITLYHPDRVNGLGLELRAIADRRAKEINAAYDTARKIIQF
jgi:DnaJ-domain-containing protein 1